MTYGWAILIIAVVLGALFQLGVFNSSSFSPRAPPGACQVFRPSGPGTTTNINLMGVCTGQLPQYVGKFNGGSSYIDTGNSVAVLNILNSITVTAWIKVSAFSAIGGIVSKYQDSSTGSWYFSLGASSPYNNVRVTFIDSAGSYRGGDNTATLTTDTWTHVAWTYGGSGPIMVYINGVGQQVGTASNPIMANPHSVYIGVQGTFFNGQIANVQVYNTSLSANQIQALYLEGIGGAPMKLQNLAGWWPLNGNANDYSGNNNNGVPTSVTFTSQYGK